MSDRTTKGGRPSNWASPTVAVRVPIHAVEQCLALARALDQPLPEATPSQEFQDYCSFVQNLANPNLFTIQNGSECQLYLMQVDPLTFEEYQQVSQAVTELESRADWQSLGRSAQLYVVSQMIEQTFEPVRPK